VRQPAGRSAGPPGSRGVRGQVNEGFQPVKDLFEAFVQADAAYPEGLCVYWRGEKVVDLLGGPGAEKGAVSPVFSATKGVAALTLSLVVEDGDLDLDRLVTHYWPEFGAQGKDGVTVRQLLAHQAGLLGTEDGLTVQDLCHSELAAAKLAASAPCWRPGSAMGYHAISMGVFIEELVRRIAGTSLQALFEERARRPYDLAFYLGLPEAADDRFRAVLPAAAEDHSARSGPDVLGDDMANWSALVRCEDGPTHLATPAFANRLDVRRAGPAAAGGVGSAEGLARAYAASLTGVDGLPPLLSAKTVRSMAQQQAWGHDRVLNVDMCFAVVFMKAQPRMPFASHRGFGHDGASGALGFADPVYDLGFGYVPGGMSYDSGRFVSLSVAVRAAVQVLVERGA
jgi:CubicO group peptidase (beta-lactamase class C family)